jgi:hypothetical protein
MTIAPSGVGSKKDDKPGEFGARFTNYVVAFLAIQEPDCRRFEEAVVEQRFSDVSSPRWNFGSSSSSARPKEAYLSEGSRWICQDYVTKLPHCLSAVSLDFPLNYRCDRCVHSHC